MRRVIRAEHIDDTLCNAAPDSGAVRRIAYRRIHLRTGAKPFVTARRFQRQVMRRRLDGGYIFVTGEIFHLLCGRNMQHVHARAGFVRDRDQSLRRLERGHFIAPDGMRASVALDTQVFAFVEPRLVFGVERRSAADDLEHRAQAGIVCDKQRTGG